MHLFIDQLEILVTVRFPHCSMGIDRDAAGLRVLARKETLRTKLDLTLVSIGLKQKKNELESIRQRMSTLVLRLRHAMGHTSHVA